MAKREGIMLCSPFDAARIEGPGRKKWDCDSYYVQPKLDGLRCRYVVDTRFLLSSEQNVFTSVPHIKEELEKLRNTLRAFGILELDGELYTHGMPFETLCSTCLRDYPVLNPTVVEYHVFDCITDNPSDSNAQRNSILQQAISTLFDMKISLKYIKIVPTILTYNITEIFQVASVFNNEGFEGIVVRNPLAIYQRKRVTSMIKFKPKKSDVYLIIGTTLLVDQYDIVHDLLGSIQLSDPEGNIFFVGTGFTDSQRAEYYRTNIVGKFCKINYQNLTEKGVPRFSSFVEILDRDPENRNWRTLCL